MFNLKKIFIIIIVICISLSIGGKVNASLHPAAINVSEQIRILQDRVNYLQSLLAKLLLEKSIGSSSYLVVDLSDGSVILEKNANQAHSIASITKLMNAVVALENISTDQSI